MPTKKKAVPHEPMPQYQDWLLRGIKIIDICYITFIYFVLGYVTAFAYDKVLGEFDEAATKKKSTLRLAAELILHVCTIAVLTYVIRNLVELIPFPLNGVYGFNHYRVKELTIAPMFSLVIIIFQDHLRAKMRHLFDRLYNNAPK
jgi:hypothetical protein